MYDEIIATGVIVPNTSEILTEVQTEFKDTFGNDLVVTENTPQGVLIAANVAARSNFLRNNAALANQFNPNISGGVFLDAMWAGTAGYRSPESYSSANVNVAGVAATIIPEGSILENANGDQFSLTGVITLNGEGTGSGVFQSLVGGPIGAPAGTLTNIINGVLGWETATNPDDATLGALTQSDASARTLRKTTLALQGSSTAEAIISAVTFLTSKSMSFRENITGAPLVVDGINMLANSIYCCVDGGNDVDVAKTISDTKAGGTNYTNGASALPVSEDITDPFSGQTVAVKFDRPDLKLILITVYVLSSTATVDPTDSVKDAILLYAAGELEGEPGFAVGANISPFEISGAINQAVPNLFIKNVTIGISGGDPQAPTEIELELWEQGYTNNTAITVTMV